MKHLNKTLLQQLKITDFEIKKRKELLDFEKNDEKLLCDCLPFIRLEIDNIVVEFYAKQTEIEEIALLIGDAETLMRLRQAMRKYILSLFEGDYSLEYVNNRLRIGLVHKRIGVSPKLYLSAINWLTIILENIIDENITDVELVRKTKRSLQKLISLDTQLVFDTYIRNMLSEIESARDNLEEYALSLEDMVAERTKELSEIARKDQLTNLFNRRAFLEYLKRDLATAERQAYPLSIAYFDVNNFKILNDTMGHQKGDEVLAKVGEILIEICRGTDIPCRYGGDEFCIILPNSTKEQAQDVCKRISAKLVEQEPKIEISVGIAQTGPEKWDDVESLLQWADELMYQSKRTSRITHKDIQNELVEV